MVQYEPGAFPPAVAAELVKRGHRLQKVREYGNMQAILWNRTNGRVIALPDRRGRGAVVYVR